MLLEEDSHRTTQHLICLCPRDATVFDPELVLVGSLSRRCRLRPLLAMEISLLDPEMILSYTSNGLVRHPPVRPAASPGTVLRPRSQQLCHTLRRVTWQDLGLRSKPEMQRQTL